MIRSEIYGPLSNIRYREYIDHIHDSGSLLQSNINDLLDLARLESGKFGWEDERFDLCAMIESAVATCQIPAQEAGIEITYEAGAPGTDLHADRSRLVQAIINLITNAVKFTDAGGSIEISTARDGAGGCIIRVSDTGCGMSAENLERVRTPFAQAHEDSYSKGKGGLGLGLAIVCGIIERIDGRFDLEGVGTVATLVLPNGRVHASEADAA
jgi:signal transduction histidine kinase